MIMAKKGFLALKIINVELTDLIASTYGSLFRVAE
jgi:hypothetical protein